MKKLVSFVLAITMMFSLSAKAIAISSESVIDVPSYSVTDIPYDSNLCIRTTSMRDSVSGISLMLPTNCGDCFALKCFIYFA